MGNTQHETIGISYCIKSSIMLSFDTLVGPLSVLTIYLGSSISPIMWIIHCFSKFGRSQGLLIEFYGNMNPQTTKHFATRHHENVSAIIKTKQGCHRLGEGFPRIAGDRDSILGNVEATTSRGR